MLDSWDQYFMSISYLVSMKSKDPVTRVGAVIVGLNKEIKATGFNGLPRGLADYKYRYEDKEFKILAINHAEENAILHCALNGTATKGCTIYTPLLACSRCARLIIQAGICEVVYDENFPGNKRFEKTTEISREILLEAKVVVRGYNGLLIEAEGLYRRWPYKLNTISHP